MSHPCQTARAPHRGLGLAGALGAALLMVACAQSPGPQPPAAPGNDKSLATVKQNPPGIVIFRGWGVRKDEAAAQAQTGVPASAADAASPAPASTSAAAAAAAPAPAAQPSTAAAAAPAPAPAPVWGTPIAAGNAPARPAPATATPANREPGNLSGWLQLLPPPTGKPVQDLKKLNDPKQGIELPTAASRPQERKDR